LSLATRDEKVRSGAPFLLGIPGIKGLRFPPRVKAHGRTRLPETVRNANIPALFSRFHEKSPLGFFVNKLTIGIMYTNLPVLKTVRLT
jgi:hypothetical protein